VRRVLLILLFVTTTLIANSELEFDSFDNEFEEEYIEVYDPLIGYNRAMTSFNDSFYKHIAMPVARGYKEVVPNPLRRGISNFFNNLFYPIRLVNNLLQFKIENAIDETNRFLINSTVGILGFRDVARHSFQIEPKNEDFGQTLGHWGLGSGVHIVLPILGPSNLRDVFGRVGDIYSDPISSNSYRDIRIPEDSWQSLGLNVIETTNDLSHNPDLYENVTKDAIDLYIFLRDSYEQKRDKEIKE
jgi:phospholipid-binding lipoprotein MlaA